MAIPTITAIILKPSTLTALVYEMNLPMEPVTWEVTFKVKLDVESLGMVTIVVLSVLTSRICTQHVEQCTLCYRPSKTNVKGI